jgi:hypothetical protein
MHVRMQALVHSHSLLGSLVPPPIATAVAPPVSKKSRGKGKRGKKAKKGGATSSTTAAAAAAESKVKPIQRQLRAFCEAYWAPQQISAATKPSSSSSAQLTPLELQTRALWSAVAQHSLFGDYDPALMEDANTLLSDMLCGIDDKLVADLCGIRLEATISCSICSARIDATTTMLSRLFRSHPVAEELGAAGLWRAVAAAAIGQLEPRQDDPETILSLPIGAPTEEPSSPPDATAGDNGGGGGGGAHNAPSADNVPPVGGAVGVRQRYAAMSIGQQASAGADSCVSVEDVCAPPSSRLHYDSCACKRVVPAL